MAKLDLFDTLVRFLAIKPLTFDSFNLEQAKSVIKKENECCVTFIGDHGYFENTLEEIVKNVAGSNIKNGTVYIYVKGSGCSERVKRNLIELDLNVSRIIIFGKSEDWEIRDSKISFVDPDDIFEDNHQRFFAFQSAGYNVALVARHSQHDGKEVIEAAMTTVDGAVSLVTQSIGTRIYGKI